MWREVFGLQLQHKIFGCSLHVTGMLVFCKQDTLYKMQVRTFFCQRAIYAQDSLLNVFVQDFTTIYAQNIIIQQVINFLFSYSNSKVKLPTVLKEKKIKSNVIFFLIINNLFEMLR